MNLPKPNISNELTLIDSINERISTRWFLDNELSVQEISNILYVAAGQLKPATKESKSKRTVPSARNSQCVSVYAVTREGVYLYNEVDHSLVLSVKGDYIDKLSSQSMMHNAPFGLLYVVDFSKLSMYTATSEERMISVSSVEVGCMSQNVSLYCASVDLGSVLVGLVDRDFFYDLLKLDNQKVLYSHVIGQKK